ncbi:MAG: 4Fe-4S binding protein [Caldisericia bacterium]|nr:4Fe-4S binding protein [Caldisericia bacterium]MDD4614312.1 4Fe-4S binding protein [Caldisericia bacterium]
MKKNRSSFSILRWILLLLILGFVTANAYFHQHPEILGKTASVCALCPTGAIESFLYWIRTGYFIHRIALSSLILLLSILVTSFLFRRSFCGQFCPLGTLQELFSSMGNQIKSIGVLRKKTKKDSFRWTKYIVIAAFIAVPWFTSSLFFRSIDPWVAYAHITTLEIFGLFLWGFLILLFSLLGSFIWDRFFCKYLCPLGGFLSILSPLGMFRIVRNTTHCTSCNKCNVVCPMNIDVCHLDEITDSECIMCFQCIDACPNAECLTISSRAGTKISPSLVALLTFFIIIGFVVITTITGHFQWLK